MSVAGDIIKYYAPLLCLSPWLFHPPFIRLELSQDTLGTSVGNALRHLIQLGVGNLAVVNDNSITLGAVTLSPADGLAELAVGVGHEELFQSLRVSYCTSGFPYVLFVRREGRTA